MLFRIPSSLFTVLLLLISVYLLRAGAVASTPTTIIPLQAENSVTEDLKTAAIIPLIFSLLEESHSDDEHTIPLTRNSDDDDIVDAIDNDDDNDGVLDNADHRPLDPTITVNPIYTAQVNSNAQTYVREDNPHSNYSSKSFIQTRKIAGSFATAGLLYFDIPPTINNAKRVDHISSADLTVKSDTEKDTVLFYAATDEGFPEAANATWNNTHSWFGQALYGQTTLAPNISGSAALNQELSAGKIVFIVDESGDDGREKLVKDNNEIYLDLTFQEIDPEIITVTRITNTKASLNGGVLQYKINLTQQPTHNVYVPVKIEDSNTANLNSVDTLLFTPENYNTAQTINIKGKDDGSNTGTKANKLLIYPLHSLDDYYNGNNPIDHAFKVYDLLIAADSGQAYSAQADYTANDNTRFSLENAPLGMSINPITGKINWQPDSSEAGSYDFTIIASENGSVINSQAVHLHVKPAASNPTNAFYVAPGVQITAPSGALGSIGNPYTNIETALQAASDSSTKRTVYVRGGLYENIEVTIDDIDGENGNPVILTRLPGERVKFTFSALSAFKINEDSSHLVFDGFEIDGKAINDHWDMLSNNWWMLGGDSNIGGGQAFNVDGQYITMRNNIIHDTFQKGVNIYKGRYVNVSGNIIYNIGHSSLSGGHGIMRKWPRNFKINPTDGVDLGLDIYTADHPYRFDITGNMLLAVEQRIYSRVFNKGYSNLTIDEGKPILIDQTEDADPKSRVSHNLVLYGGVDHIRLKQNPNMEVHNNSILAELARTDTTPDGITDKNRLPNLKFYGNLVVSKGVAIEVDDSFTDSDGNDEDVNKIRKYDNYVAGGGSITKAPIAGITNLGGTDASQLFSDIANNNFSSVVAGNKVTPGVSAAHLDHLMNLREEHGLRIEPSGWRHDHLKNAEHIIENVPAAVFDRSTYYIGPSSVEEGHQAIFLKFIDSDGKWLYTKREVDGVNWGALLNKDLTEKSAYDLDDVDIQKCDSCKGAYSFQLILPHEWFEEHGNESNTSFTLHNSDNTTTNVVYLNPDNDTEHENILKYSAEGSVTSY